MLPLEVYLAFNELNTLFMNIYYGVKITILNWLRHVTLRGEKKMRTDTAQRILWIAIIFIVLTIIVTIFAAIGLAIASGFYNLGSFIPDPTARAFIEAYPWLPSIVLMALAVVEVIYLAIIYLWRQDPMKHRTGFTILGILQLLIGWSLPGLLILLPGLLLEEQ
jgi:hypothetical protein